MGKILWAFIFMTFTSQLSFAATDCSTQVCRYVRAGATGTGVDWSNALGALPATLTRGATYFIADGSYPGYTFDDAVSGTSLITIKKATVADHGTATGWLDSYGDGQAAFTSGFDFTTSYYLIDGQTGGGPENYWSLNFGFKVTETGDSSAIINVASSGTANYITLSHIALQGKGSVSSSGGSWSNDGVAIYGASNFTLSYFHMKGIGRCPFFLSAQNVLIEYGWVEKYYGSEAVHSEVASIWAFDGSIGDMTFRNNLFTDIQSTGGLMWDNSSNKSARLFVYGNVFYKPAGAVWGQANGVVGGWTGGGGEQFHNAKVYNNTFINVDQESLSSLPQTFSGNEAYNNIFYNSSAPNFAKFASHDHNLFINSGSIQGEANGVALSGVNPFVNITAYDFRLLSPTAAGRTLASPFDIDPLKVVRGSDGTWDRGAYEYGGAPVPATPTPIPTATPIPATPTPTPVPTATPVLSGESLLGSLSPAILSSNDGVEYELGMKFISDVAGTIQAIRFYKGPAETGTHTGKIYSASGALLASVVFSNETGSGWQQQALATPLAIAANTIYVVSVNTGGGYYVDTVGGMATQLVGTHLRSVVSNNGVYGSVGSMPTNSWGDSNYFRDVVFSASAVTPTPTPSPTPSPTPVPTPTPTPVPGDTQAPSVSITSPVNGSTVAANSKVTISASASDNVGVSKVEFYVNGALTCSDTSAPYACTWSVPRKAGRNYQLQVKAYDSAGNVGSSAVTLVTSR